MNEELLQRDLLKNPDKIGKWDFYSIGATSIKTLKEAGIIHNINYGSEESKKVDALLVLRKNVIAVVEYKDTSKLKTKAQQDKAINQEINVAKKLNAKIIIATDTVNTVWVNVQTGNRIKDEDGNEMKYNFDPKDEKLPTLIEKISFSIHELNDQIKPQELVNPTGLAKQIWQDIWSVSGATPENCLYTFVELFIFKYLSDLKVLQEPENFDYLIQLYEKRDVDYVLEYYANNVRSKIKNLFPEGNDKTTIINGTIFVSKDQKAVKGYSTVFKKVLEKFKNYGKLENIDYDFKSQLFESFLKESISKKNWGQFFTPLKVVRAIIEMAKDEIKDGIKICDPACGVGKFLLEPLITRLDYLYEINKHEIKPKLTIHGFDKGFDKDEQKTIILAKANMLIYFSDLLKENAGLTTKFSDLFNQSFQLKTNSILGTLSDAIENEYDLILTNPPYVTSGSSNLKEEIKKDSELSKHYKINALGVEGLFMEWIIKALKPAGKAFIVVPDGLFTRQNDKNMRQFLMDECFIDGIISLPIKTFFTTPKKTYILCITKKENKKIHQTDPVFTYLVSEIGETRDTYRFDIEQNDLQEAVTLYTFFKGNKQSFSKYNSDKRCKVQPFEKFKDAVEKSWAVDLFWSIEEKIEIGALEEESSIRMNEYSDLLSESANSILALKEELSILMEKKLENTTFKPVRLDDIFTIVRGNSKLTKAFLDKNKGDLVVYSANTKQNGIFGYINTYDHDVECIQITTNGVYAGTVFYRPKHKFSINGDAGLLIKNNDNLDYHYLAYQVQKAFASHNFNWENKPTSTKIKDILINIPVNGDGEFDIETQLQIAEKFKRIEGIKLAISEELNKLTSPNIDFES